MALKIIDYRNFPKVKETVKNIELKKCPFCGKDGVIFQEFEDCFHVNCSFCKARIDRLYSTLEEVVNAWNTRTKEE